MVLDTQKLPAKLGRTAVLSVAALERRLGPLPERGLVKVFNRCVRLQRDDIVPSMPAELLMNRLLTKLQVIGLTLIGAVILEVALWCRWTENTALLGVLISALIAYGRGLENDGIFGLADDRSEGLCGVDASGRA
jgi:hypothetical protein